MNTAEVETRIVLAALKLATASTRGARRKAWSELQRFHWLRTPDQVRNLERQRGLL